jgi:hypothetical protein
MKRTGFVLALAALVVTQGCVSLDAGGPRLYSGTHQGIFAPPTVGGAAAIPLWTYPDPAARSRVNAFQTLGVPGLGQVNVQSACAYGGCPLWR